MRYTIEKKKEIVTTKPEGMDVRAYCKQMGISYSSYYKWYKELYTSDSVVESVSFIDVTNLINETDNNVIDLELSDITIHVSPNYNESHLLRLINTIKKL